MRRAIDLSWGGNDGFILDLRSMLGLLSLLSLLSHLLLVFLSLWL